MDPDEFFSKEKNSRRHQRRDNGKRKRTPNKKAGAPKPTAEDRKLVADEDFVQGRWFECMPEWIQTEDGRMPQHSSTRFSGSMAGDQTFGQFETLQAR